MAENSKIEWTDHTFNPWIGCQAVSPACDHCYAETQNNFRHWVDGWGPHGERRRTSASTWAQPLKWNREAARLGIRPRVFCASLADWLDNRVPRQWRYDLAQVIVDTPNLDWLLLTKRPENYEKHGPWERGNEPANVLFGVTVESAEYRRRIWTMLASIGEKSRVFISYEPAMGPLGRLRDVWHPGDTPRLAWVICGGESGGSARPMHPDWARDARDQCAELGIPFFFKQWGEWLAGENYFETRPAGPAKWQDGETGQHSTCKNRPESKTPEWRHFGTVGEPGAFTLRVGKKRAGARLDGVEHREFPA